MAHAANESLPDSKPGHEFKTDIVPHCLPQSSCDLEGEKQDVRKPEGENGFEVRGVLQVSVDPEGKEESEFRILIGPKGPKYVANFEGPKFVKYLTIDGGIYDADTMCWDRTLIPLLPPLPPDPLESWNVARISKDPVNGIPYLASWKKVHLARITHVWHPLNVDYFDLQMGAIIRTNVREAIFCGSETTTGLTKDTTIIAKFARFDWEIAQLAVEVSAYRWIQAHQIGLKFLGNITEEGRAIGFIMERITDFEHAGPEHLALCQQALSKLHTLGIKHGDINKHNILIRDQQAILIDFEGAAWCDDAEALRDELEKLPQELRDTSGRGGIIFENDSD